MRKLIAISVISIILLLSFVLAQSTNPYSASNTGIEKNIFKSSDSISVRSARICEPATQINLYVVEDNNNWTDGNLLEDVRGAPETVLLISSSIPLTKIWDKPISGKYDLVVDCNRNGKYDQFIDKIDSFTNAGFEVEAVPGIGRAEKGVNNTKDVKWFYDVEDPNLYVEIIQIALTANLEDIDLKNITLIAFGSGDDTLIDSIEVYVDENNNGMYDKDELLIGESQPSYLTNNGKTTVDIEYFLNLDVLENIIIVYKMKVNSSEGEYYLKVDSIIGVGGNSNKAIRFLGTPIESKKLTVLPRKTCIGEAFLLLSPNPIKAGLNVEAEISELNGCDGREAVLSTNPCGTTFIKSVGKCTLKSGICTVTFKSNLSATYYACIDKNQDGDFLDFGEFAFDDLIVEAPVVQNTTKPAENETESEEEEETEVEVKEEKQNTTGGITRGISGIVGEITQTNSFLILLEVTLLLILFVLVMILFRLKPVVVETVKEEPKEEPKETLKEAPKQEEKNGKEKKKK